MKKYLDKIRSLINRTVDRYGYDKALHFLVAAFLTSAATPLGIWAATAMAAMVMVLSYIKERCMDPEFNMDDILFSLYGCLTSIVAYLPVMAIKAIV